MNRRRWIGLMSFIALLSASTTLAHEKPAATGADGLGRVHLAISCSPAAQEQFDRGLAMLHSFWFPRAPEAFAAIGQSEPACAMAHWGVAMSQRGNPLVGAPTRAAMETGAAAI